MTDIQNGHTDATLGVTVTDDSATVPKGGGEIRVERHSGFVVMYINTWPVKLTRKSARQLGAALNKAGL